MDTTKSAMKYVENKNINGRKGKRIKKMKNKKTQKWNKKESNDKNKEVKVKLQYIMGHETSYGYRLIYDGTSDEYILATQPKTNHNMPYAQHMNN